MTIKTESGQIQISPGQAGYNEKTLAILDNHFLELITNNKLQCTGYLLERKGKIFAWKTMGAAQYDNPSSTLKPDAIRPLASVTKAFTSAAVMKAVEEGLLHIEQSVSEIIPAFNTKEHYPITIFHLLTHTSGIEGMPGYYQEPFPRKIPEFKDFDEFVKYSLAGPWFLKPGQKWQYTSANHAILGEIIKRVSGVSFKEYLKSRILDPLELTDTFFIVPGEKRCRVCLVEEDEKTSLLNPTESLYDPAGALCSTMKDMARFCRMFLDKGMYGQTRILGRKTVEKMTSNQLKNVEARAWECYTPDKKYGLGWSIAYRSIVSSTAFDHEGAGRVIMIADPQEDLVAVYMVPTTIPWVPESIISPMGIIWSGLE